MRAFVCFLVLCALSGCGAPESSADGRAPAEGVATTAVLEHIRELNKWGRHPRFWSQLDVDLDAWAEAEKRLAFASYGELAVRPADARSRLRDADVVLVPDIHNLPAIQQLFGRLLRGSSLTRSGREWAVGLEFFTPDQAQMAATGTDTDALRTVSEASLSAYWPLPNATDIVQASRSMRAPLIGLATSGTFEPTEGELAGNRMIESGGLRVPAAALERHIVHSNLEIARRIGDWMESGDPTAPRGVVALIGKGHISGPNGLTTLLARRRLSVVVLVAFLPTWELTLRERFPRDAGRWIRPIPGHLALPRLADADVLSMSLSEPRRPIAPSQCAEFVSAIRAGLDAESPLDRRRALRRVWTREGGDNLCTSPAS